MRPSAFDPAPTPLPLRVVLGIALVLVAGVSLSVMEYLESTQAVQAAPKPACPSAQDDSPEWPYAEPVTSTDTWIFVPYQGG